MSLILPPLLSKPHMVEEFIFFLFNIVSVNIFLYSLCINKYIHLNNLEIVQLHFHINKLTLLEKIFKQY